MADANTDIGEDGLQLMRRPTILRLVPFLFCGAALLSCEGAPEPELTAPSPTLGELQLASARDGNPFLGAWSLTSAVLGDDELLSGRQFQYVWTFWGDGTHAVSVAGDADHLVCPAPNTSCDWVGSYTYTGTTITTVEPGHPDPGEQGEDTALYALCANKLIVMDEADGDGVRLTFLRTRQDCYVRDCD